MMHALARSFSGSPCPPVPLNLLAQQRAREAKWSGVRREGGSAWHPLFGNQTHGAERPHPSESGFAGHFVIGDHPPIMYWYGGGIIRYVFLTLGSCI